MDRVVIAGGKVVDGTGAPAVAADVAIEGDRIVEIGAGLRGDRRLDADGCVVAPGFVDIHTHYDAQVFWDPALTPSCYHGVTTVVAGNCGFSIAPTRPDRSRPARSHDGEGRGHGSRVPRGRDPVGGVRVVPRVPRCCAQARRRRSTTPRTSGTRRCGSTCSAPRRPIAPRPPTRSRRWPRSIEEAMEAGAAGFATSMALTHVGADGRPIPSRVAAAGGDASAVPCGGPQRARSHRRQRWRGPLVHRVLRLAAELRRADHVHRGAHGAERCAPEGRGDPP